MKNLSTQYQQLEVITRSSVLGSGSFDEVLKEIGSHLAACFEVERINIWLLKKQDTCIQCIGNYNTLTEKFSKGDRLFQKDIPFYFRHIREDRILAINDVMTDPLTVELRDSYCKKHNIHSMMDVPIRIEGKLVGVVCYEHTGEPREWTRAEMDFAMTLNQVVAMAIESQYRKLAQLRLQKALKEKEMLMTEMHHRVKNNLAILISLLRLQEGNTKDKKVIQVLADTQHRIFSIMKIHQLLYSTGTYLTVNLKQYLGELIEQFDAGASGQEIEVRTELESIKTETDKAITIGLIVNEIVSNAFKHAFSKNKKGRIHVKLSSKAKKSSLVISDNGGGFDHAKALKKGGLGLSLVEDLCRQIKADLSMRSDKKGTVYTMVF